jgi:hypothetical protein
VVSTSTTQFPVLTYHNSDSLAQSLPGNITTVQLLKWNPNIMGLCDGVTAGQYICKRHVFLATRYCADYFEVHLVSTEHMSWHRHHLVPMPTQEIRIEEGQLDHLPHLCARPQLVILSQHQAQLRVALQLLAISTQSLRVVLGVSTLPLKTVSLHYSCTNGIRFWVQMEKTVTKHSGIKSTTVLASQDQ